MRPVRHLTVFGAINYDMNRGLEGGLVVNRPERSARLSIGYPIVSPHKSSWFAKSSRRFFLARVV
jgi:hypothetical protein